MGSLWYISQCTESELQLSADPYHCNSPGDSEYVLIHGRAGNKVNNLNLEENLTEMFTLWCL